jgi:ketosteroid isomerase-like protein
MKMIGSIIARKAIKAGFDAINEGNIDKFMRSWRDDATFYYPGRVKAGGEYIGKDQIRKWFEGFVRQFPQRKFTINYVGVDNIFDVLGNNTLFAQLDLELINKNGFNCTNSGVSCIKIQGAKIVKVEDFLKKIDGEEYTKGWEE